jgi:hypothetical protein
MYSMAAARRSSMIAMSVPRGKKLAAAGLQRRSFAALLG